MLATLSGEHFPFPPGLPSVRTRQSSKAKILGQNVMLQVQTKADGRPQSVDSLTGIREEKELLMFLLTKDPG